MTISTRTVGKAVAVLVGGTAIAQALGIARELFVASQVGLSQDLDALLIGLTLPTTLASALSSGTGTALVPAYAAILAENGPRAARRLVGAVLTWAVICGVVLTIALFTFADPIVAVIGLGLDAPSRRLAAGYLQLLAPVALFGAAQGILIAQSQVEERFISISAATFAYPLVTFGLTVGLWAWLGIDALALGYLAGPIAAVGILVLAGLRASTFPLPALLPRRVGLRELVSHATPLTVSAAMLQLNTITDRAIASIIGPGAVSALRYGEALMRTPIGAIAPAWGAAIYPALVKAAQQPGQEQSLGLSTALAVRYALVAFIPIAVLAAALAPLGVEVAYGRGAFTTEDAAVTSAVVAAFAPLLLALMVSPILTSAHNAVRRGSVLLATGILNVILNLVLNIVFGSVIGAAGLALSSSVTSTLLVIFLASRLTELGATDSTGDLWLTFARSLVAIAIPALPIAALAWSGIIGGDRFPAFPALVILGIAALAAYAAISRRMGYPEIDVLIRASLRPFRRSSNVYQARGRR